MKKQLKEMGFNIDKQLGIGIRRKIYVDDTTKRFAISRGNDLRVYDYKDLLGFDLSEDGNTTTQGRGLATLAGGLAFGTTGAIIGAMGARKSKNICTDLTVSLILNDLQEPRFIVKYIVKPMKKSGMNYQAVSKQAQELLALLTYIDSQN